MHSSIRHSDALYRSVYWRSHVHVFESFQPRLLELLCVLTPFHGMWDGHLGHISSSAHRIELKSDAAPIFQIQYHAVPAHRDTELGGIARMLKVDFIELATTEWASPVAFSPKTDRSLRFFIDYCRLNAFTVRDSYPIPRMGLTHLLSG